MSRMRDKAAAGLSSSWASVHDASLSVPHGEQASVPGSQGVRPL